jgi:hypothetical protein
MEFYKKSGIKQENPNETSKINKIDQIENLMKDFKLEKLPEKP